MFKVFKQFLYMQNISIVNMLFTRLAINSAQEINLYCFKVFVYTLNFFRSFGTYRMPV